MAMHCHILVHLQLKLTFTWVQNLLCRYEKSGQNRWLLPEVLKRPFVAIVLERGMRTAQCMQVHIVGVYNNQTACTIILMFQFSMKEDALPFVRCPHIDPCNALYKQEIHGVPTRINKKLKVKISLYVPSGEGVLLAQKSINV